MRKRIAAVHPDATKASSEKIVMKAVPETILDKPEEAFASFVVLKADGDESLAPEVDALGILMGQENIVRRSGMLVHDELFWDQSARFLVFFLLLFDGQDRAFLMTALVIQNNENHLCHVNAEMRGYIV